jgi:hypothetical protein
MDSRAERPPSLLWLALWAGPGAAALAFGVDYALVKWACQQQGAPLLIALALGAGLLCLTASWLGLQTRRRLVGAVGDAAADRSDLYRFLLAVFVGLNVLLALLTVIAALLPLSLSPCAP